MIIMAFKILSPEEAKKRAKANVAEWLRKKEIDEKKAKIESKKTKEKPNPIQKKEKTVAKKTEPKPRAISKSKIMLKPEEQQRLNEDLVRATREGNIGDVKYYLKRGANIDGGDNVGTTPLMAALWAKKTDIVNLLIRKGANVNATDQLGRKVLWFARDNPEYIELLKKKGAKE